MPTLLTGRSKGFTPGPELVLLPLFFLYLVTALPAIGWRDNSEFAVTAFSLGVAHPAGFPTYSLLTKVLTFLPLAGAPFRITLASALYSLICLYILYRMIIYAPTIGPDESTQSRSWAAAGTILVFGLTSTLWTNSTEAEVYSLNILFLAGLFYCALRWTGEGRDAWLYAGAFLYGLAAGNHGSVGFYLPGLLFYFLFQARRDIPRRLGLIAFFFLLGFSVYLYLPLRADANPAFDFGHPNTWDRLLMHLTDRKDSEAHFVAARVGLKFLDHLWIFISQTAPPVFWILGLPLTLIGAWRLWRRDWPLVIFLAYASAINIFFFLHWAADLSNYLPAFLIAAYLAGLGGSWLLSRSALGSSPLLLGSALALIFIAWVGLRLPVQDRSRSFIPLESYRADFEALPPEAITITGHQWFHQRAYQDIMRLREDVTVILSSDFVWPQWFNPVTPARFPRADVPPDPFFEAEKGEYLKKFVRANLEQGRDIYCEPFDLGTRVFYTHLKPALPFNLKFQPQSVEKLQPEEVQSALNQLRRKLEKELESEGLVEEVGLHAHYIDLMFRYAQFFERHREIGASLAILRFLEDMFGPAGTNTMWPNYRARLHEGIGHNLLAAGRYGEAAVRFEAAIALDRYDYVAWANLGLARLKENQLEPARQALEQALTLDPKPAEALYNLGEYYRKLNQPRTARQYYARARELVDSPQTKAQIDQILTELDKAAQP
ncbi:MAG: DUF2723 domain-containing protein [Thermodesulfobacteriota bacterium]